MIRRNNVLHIAEQVESRQEALNRVSSLFIHLQQEIAELERQLSPEDGTVLNDIRVDEATERRQAVLRINMQAAEKAYIVVGNPIASSMLIRADISKSIIGGHGPPVQRNNDLFCQEIIKIHTMNKIKIVTGLVSIYCIFCFAQCKKSNPDSNGLPAPTQEGKNTLGFLLNGQPWTPQGNNGTANLSLYYDATLAGGGFNLAAYRIISTGVRQRLTIFGDSIQYAQRIILPNPNKFGAIFRNDVSGCDYDISDTAVKITGGYFDLKKLDKINNIFSGEFEIKFKKAGCEDIQISQGRFDMKF